LGVYMGRRKRARKEREVKVGGVSVVVKISLFTAVSYLSFLLIYQVLSNVVGINGRVFGINGEVIFDLISAIVIAASLLIGGHIFIWRRVKEIADRISRLGGQGAVQDKEDEIGVLVSAAKRLASKRWGQSGAMRQSPKEEGLGIAKDRIEAEKEEISLLYEIGKYLNSTMEIKELYDKLIELLPAKFNLDKFAILVADEKKEFLSVEAAYGFTNIGRICDLAFRMGEGVSGEAALKGEMIYLPDAEKDSRFLHYRGEALEKGSFISIPLKYKGETFGVMNCSRAAKHGFSEDDIRLLVLVANEVALAVQNARLYTRMKELSVRDELTGLYNRRHFQHVLQMEWKRVTRFKRPLSLLMIDIDHFKEFNDTFGHRHGDRVLRHIATTLAKNLREVDLVARFGGEEFVVLLPDTDKNGAIVVAEKLRRLVEGTRFDDVSNPHYLSISIGLSNFPEDAREMDDLIDHADIALYEAKDAGRNRVVVYSDIGSDEIEENPPIITN
jgi:diguanylate cyclase (GGDEF)-like protein